jgi:ABC-type lipoprotein release transport system permease subunit
MKLYALLLLSLRSVGRNARRSILTATAMALGLALLIFSRAIAEGGHEQWIDSAVRLGTGHVAIQAPDYLETGRLEHRLDSARVQRVVAALEDPAVAPLVSLWVPRLTVSGLATSASSALPVRIEGVDPARERVFSTLPDQLRDGRYLEPDDRLHAFVGEDLARRLDLEMGSRFVLTAQVASGQVEGQMMRVAGIFHTGIQEMDEGLVHVPIGTVRRWLGVPGAATTLAVLLESTRDTDGVVRRLDQELDGAEGIRVLGWRQASPEMDSAVRIDDYGDYLFHTILFAIIALAILNAIMMSVLGRRREFGILQALGLTGGETGLVVLGEGLCLTAASGLIGMVAGFIFTWVFFRHGLDFSAFMESMTASGGVINPVIVPVFRLDQVFLSVVSILVIGTLASLYPAFRATRLDVAEAVKFEQ